MMPSGVAVVTFPGSNGDHDALHALASDIGIRVALVDYRCGELDGYEAVVIPGGFSYGDYLRCGAIARFTPVMNAVQQFASRGGPVLGICNGFQILTETKLLPGALLRNQALQFVCDWIHVRVEQTTSPWTSDLLKGDVLRLPIAHGDGAYFADKQTIEELEHGGQVVFRYCKSDGSAGASSNPNGAVSDIAGITNKAGNVLGMMPHPERATDLLTGGNDGARLLNHLFHLLQVPA